MLVDAVSNFLTSRPPSDYSTQEDPGHEASVGNSASKHSCISLKQDMWCNPCLLQKRKTATQAVAALLEHVQQSIAPRVQSGTWLLAQFHKTRLLPTGCARSADISPSKLLHCCRPLRAGRMTSVKVLSWGVAWSWTIPEALHRYDEGPEPCAPLLAQHR